MSTSWSATPLPDSATAGAGKTMTRFDGQIKRGDSLVVIQGELRLKVWALEEFTGAAGARAALTVSIEEVLAGSFPSHIDELILNANGWDIYLADDPSIPPLKVSSHLELIEALEIFGKVGSPYSRIFTDSGELKFYEVPENFSEDQLERLKGLGWHSVPGVGFYFYT